MLRSKFFRVAVEGGTTDGRNIDRKWLEDMAANYDSEKYTALINIEHIRGYGPSNEFGNYGKVLNLKTEEFEIDGEKRLALMAQINPNANLLALNEKGQKLFTSIEINPEFGGKEQTYLTGLAVTDSPASLGTEMLQFSASAKDSPLAGRKQQPSNIFSAALEADFEFNEDSPADVPGDKNGLLNKVKAMFSKSHKNHSDQFTDVHNAVEEIAGAVSDLQSRFSTLDNTIEKFDALEKKINETNTAYTQFKEKIENTDFYKQRPPAAGGDGAITTDC